MIDLSPRNFQDEELHKTGIFSAKNWDEFIGQLQRKFDLHPPVMKNYRFDYQIKDKDMHNSTEHYGLTEDDEFQYAIQGAGYRYILYQNSMDDPPGLEPEDFSNIS